MNQNIITYLNENREKYSKEALVAELQKSGYAEGDISSGVAQVFGLSATTKTSFWNFKDKKVYTKASEKWADFLFGFFLPFLFGLFPYTILGWGGWEDMLGAILVLLPICIVIIAYCLYHRKFIVKGMFASAVILPLILMIFTVAVLSHHGF